MTPILRQLIEIPIPGVTQSLLLSDWKERKRDALSMITGWTAGVSWEMRADTEVISEKEVWDKVRQGLEDLVRGILTDRYSIEINADSESFRTWARLFIENTSDIEWFCHEIPGYGSWYYTFITKMREWEGNNSLGQI